MKNYRFGLKKLNEKARVTVKLKSLFALTPIKETKETLAFSLIPPEQTLTVIGCISGIYLSTTVNIEGDIRDNDIAWSLDVPDSLDVKILESDNSHIKIGVCYSSGPPSETVTVIATVDSYSVTAMVHTYTEA